MKFARRAEGIKSGRSIFKKAREDVRTRHHVYVTAALMEYYCSKVSSAAPGVLLRIHYSTVEFLSLIGRSIVFISSVGCHSNHSCVLIQTF